MKIQFLEGGRKKSPGELQQGGIDKPWLGRSKGIKAEKAVARLRGRISVKGNNRRKQINRNSRR